MFCLPYLFVYSAHSCITRTLNFLVENWYKFFFTFSQLRPMIFSDKCWKRVTKYLLTTYHGKVNYQYKHNFQMKFTNNFKLFKVWFIIRFSKQLFPFFLSYFFISVPIGENICFFVRIRLLQQNWPISAPLSRGLRLGCKQTWRTKISSSNLKYLWSLCKI